MLPTEVWATVFGYLDPIADRDTLIRLVRVCSFYELVMPFLYREMTLDGLGINKIVAAGLHLSREDGATYDNSIRNGYDLVTTHHEWQRLYRHLLRPARNSR